MKFLSRGPVRPPKVAMTLLEGPRMGSEIASLLSTPAWMGRVPKGDGHPVIVIPGFAGDDYYNLPVTRFLRQQGYHATGWNMGRNMGHGLLDPDLLIARINKLYKYERRKVTLIGHSLGGIYAREIARLWPHEIRQVITLSSPFGEGRSTASWLTPIYKLLSPHRGIDDETHWADAPPVPATAIYSRSDGVIDWRVSLQCRGHEHTENVEICSSHNGITLNPVTWYLLADRLGQPAAHWQPFKRSGFRRLFFPKPAWTAQDIGPHLYPNKPLN